MSGDVRVGDVWKNRDSRSPFTAYVVATEPDGFTEYHRSGPLGRVLRSRTSNFVRRFKLLVRVSTEGKGQP